MSKKGELQKGVPSSIENKTNEEVTSLMHCYNLQMVFPETMKKLEKTIINDLTEEGASTTYIRKIQAKAADKSYWGTYHFVDMYSRLKSMAKLMGRDMKDFHVAPYTLYKKWKVSAV